MNKEYIKHLLVEINNRQKETLYLTKEIKKELEGQNKKDKRGNQ